MAVNVCLLAITLFSFLSVILRLVDVNQGAILHWLSLLVTIAFIAIYLVSGRTISLGDCYRYLVEKKISP
ncbi:hypothetical protein [Photobacterium satsumensis]|uniref:hypothetical protein n=1 Tax=Photobacterium satsumensis TaxID=2910239 RepID=UPI003D13AA9D